MLSEQEKKEAIDRLRQEVEREGVFNERKCAKKLLPLANVLLTTVHGHITYVECEQRLAVGAVDLIIRVETSEHGSDKRAGAYVWELKAPQVSLFEIETNGRACPSKELYSAENQLLHYYDELLGSGKLQREWNVHRDYIKLGGIIIGRNCNFIQCTEEKLHESRELADEAMRVRNLHFYEKANFKVLTWDDVLEILEVPAITNTQFTGDGSVEVREADGGGELLRLGVELGISFDAKVSRSIKSGE